MEDSKSVFLFNFIIRDRLVFSWKAPASRHMLQPRLSLNPMVYMKSCSNGTMSPHPIYCGYTQSCRKCPKVMPGWLCTSCIYTHLQQLQWWHTSMLQRKSRPNAVCGGTNQTGCHGHLWHNSRANGTARAHINKSHHAWHGTLTQEKKRCSPTSLMKRTWWNSHPGHMHVTTTATVDLRLAHFLHNHTWRKWLQQVNSEKMRVWPIVQARVSAWSTNIKATRATKQK